MGGDANSSLTGKGLVSNDRSCPAFEVKLFEVVAVFLNNVHAYQYIIMWAIWPELLVI